MWTMGYIILLCPLQAQLPAVVRAYQQGRRGLEIWACHSLEGRLRASLPYDHFGTRAKQGRKAAEGEGGRAQPSRSPCRSPHPTPPVPVGNVFWRQLLIHPSTLVHHQET